MICLDFSLAMSLSGNSGNECKIRMCIEIINDANVK